MKKKIFISGKTREFDSANPEPFCKEIEEYIKANQVDPKCTDDVKVRAYTSGSDEITIECPFSTGDSIMENTVSRPLYRIFTGECESFRAKNSLWWTIGFGPDYKMNVRIPIEDIIEAHKKNTRFYKANRYKSLDIVEVENGLIIKIQY